MKRAAAAAACKHLGLGGDGLGGAGGCGVGSNGGEGLGGLGEGGFGDGGRGLQQGNAEGWLCTPLDCYTQRTTRQPCCSSDEHTSGLVVTDWVAWAAGVTEAGGLAEVDLALERAGWGAAMAEGALAVMAALALQASIGDKPY